MNISRGGAVAILTVTSDSVEVVDAKQFTERLKNGIHVVFTPNIRLVKKIQRTRTDLWSFWNNDIYRHYDTILEIDNVLKKKTYPLKTGEQSDPFEYKGNMYMVQKVL